jgi:GWxTD domain-containing protein
VHQGSKAAQRTVRAAAAAFSLCLGASALLAQSVEQRRTLDAFRDSLSSVTDSAVLAGQEARLMAVVRKNRNDAFLHLRLGQLALRQADVGGPSHYDDAASEFNWSTELAPQWPYAWYGLGLSEFALGARAEETGVTLTRDAWTRAADAFAHAVALEPGLAPRLEELARQALRARAALRAGVIRDALIRAVHDVRGQREGRLMLALGRVQRDMGDSTARATFAAYLANGEDRGLALLELGRTRLLSGDLDGASDYLEGLTTDDPGAVAEARNDFLPIASDAQLADFDLRHGSARADMVRRFWTTRDRVELRPEGSRLAEHLRRLAIARQEFVFTGEDGVERPDDRGRVFIRHGEPDDRASFTLPGVEPNESWRYRRGSSDMVLHFSARHGPKDFRLIESVLDVTDVRSSVGLDPSSIVDVSSASSEQLLRSRSALAPLYQQRPAGNAEQVTDFLARERALGRRGIQLGTLTDSYTLRFPIELNSWGHYAVGGGSGSEPAVQVLFAIPGYAIEPASGTVGFVYPVRVRFVALDTAGNVVASVDSTIRIEPGDRIAANRSLVGQIAIPVRPGRLTVQAAIQYGNEAGTAFGVDTVTVPSPGSGVLALGDLLVGTRRGRLVVPLGDGTQLAMQPGGVARRSDGVDLAVEVFGLAPGAVADLRLYLTPRGGAEAGPNASPQWRLFPDRRATARVTRRPGGGPIARWRVALPLQKLKAGSWLLAVVATDLAGHEVRREAPLTVLVP